MKSKVGEKGGESLSALKLRSIHERMVSGDPVVSELLVKHDIAVKVAFNPCSPPSRGAGLWTGGQCKSICREGRGGVLRRLAGHTVRAPLKKCSQAVRDLFLLPHV